MYIDVYDTCHRLTSSDVALNIFFTITDNKLN